MSPPIKNEPWHLWGQTKTIELLSTGAPTISNQQLARVDYHRPETWSFFFGVNLLDVSGPPLADVDFSVSIDVLPGVGLTFFDTFNSAPLFTPPADLTFAFFRFHLPAGSLPIGNIVTRRWTTSTRSPLLDDLDVTSRLPIDRVVAQNLQCKASVSQSTGGPNIGAKFEVTAMFAPRVHVRPEWWKGEFPGGEIGGK